MGFQRKGECLVTHYRKETSAPWGEEHSSHHITRASAKEDTNSVVGTWTYPQGTYSVARRKQDGLYLYEETCYRIYGRFADEDGWVVGKIYTLRTTDDEKSRRSSESKRRIRGRTNPLASGKPDPSQGSGSRRAAPSRSACRTASGATRRRTMTFLVSWLRTPRGGSRPTSSTETTTPMPISTISGLARCEYSAEVNTW